VDVETGRAPADGTDLASEVAGSVEWIVFAHGGEGTRLHWWQQVAYFAARYRCVTFDARGFGSSPAGTAGPSENLMRDDLLAILDHLGPDMAGPGGGRGCERRAAGRGGRDRPLGLRRAADEFNEAVAGFCDGP